MYKIFQQYLMNGVVVKECFKGVARNFWGQGRFLKTRAQIHDSSERLNYKLILPRTSLKNNYLYQILISLASILTRVYNFMIKRIPLGFNIFTRKNTRCDVSLPIPYIGPSLSRDHQTVANESKNILFLNASAKDRDARETSRRLVLMGNCPTCCPTHVLPLLSQ